MMLSHRNLHRSHPFLAGAIALAALLSPAQPAHSASPPAVKDACQSGRAQYQSGDVLKAIASLERCVEKEPRHREGWVTLATARLEAGRFPEAADAYGRAHALKPGDGPFLASYLDALEGAGRASEKVPVLRALSESRSGGERYAERLLALVDSLGAKQYPGDRIFALEKLGQGPDATLQHQGLLAAAYLEQGMLGKSQAEYRGLLSRRPENGEYWAGLAASIAAEDREAARECYRKAIFYSNTASLRAAYEKEMAALGAAKPAAAVVAASAPSKPEAKPPVPAPAPAVAKAPEAKPAAKPAEPAKAVAAKPFDAKAYEDSVFKAELEKRMAAIRKSEAAVKAPAASLPPAAPSTSTEEDERKAKSAKAEKEKQEKLAREEKEKQERLAKEEKEKQERLAKEEKEKQERFAREAAKKAEEEQKLKDKLAKEEKERQDKLAREGKEKQERLAKEEKARQEKAAKESREARDRFIKDSTAQAEKERLAKQETERKAREEQERLAREDAKRKADEEKARKEREKVAQDSVAKAEKERLAKEEIEKKAREARDRFVRDSLAKVEKERLARLEAERKAKEARDLFVRDSLAKVEKERLARLEAERKAKEARDLFVRDSLAKVEKARLAKLEEERKAREARERFVKDSLAQVEKARLAKLEEERKIREARERFVRDSLAKVEQERLAKLEAERKAREKQERHDRAIAFYRSGQLDSADALFPVVLGESPTPDAHYYGGRTHLDKGRPDKALELLLKTPKDRPEIDGLLGKAYLRKGKRKEALEAFERQVAKTPYDVSLLEEICTLKKPAADASPWAACVEKLSGLRPNAARHHEELAVHYRKQGDKAKSLDRWSKLLVLEPAHGEANYHLGMDWGASGVHDRAVPCLEKAVAAFPARSEAWKLLAKGQAALFRKEAAWASYQKAAALLPGDVEVARGRLALAKDPGREAELPGAYQAVLKLAPDDAAANLGYAQLRFAARDWPAAERHFRLGIKDSKSAAAWGQYGRSLLETKKLDEAALALQKALDLGETSVALRFDLARLHLDKGDADKAEALVKQIAAKAPADPEPHYWLGRIAEKRQQAAVQEEHHRKANQLRPDEPRYAEAVARLYRDRDEFKQAVSVLSPLEAKLSTEGRMLLADCLAAAGEGRRALDIYSELFRKQPGPALLSRRIDALVRMGKAGEAADAARGTAFADKPEVQYSLAKAHLALAESHVLKGDLDLAVKLLKSALDADGHRPELHYHLGMAWYRKGRPGKAKDAFTDALRYRVDYPEAVYWKGVCLIEEGGIIDARNYFGELSQHADLRWKARGLFGLARVFEAEGKWEAVEHHLVRAISTVPQPDAMAHLSRVHFKLGRFPEAEDWARKALAIEADHEAATMALAEALAARKKVPEALGLTEAALRVKPLSCDLLVQSAKLNLEAGRIDSTLTTTGKAIQVCPQEPLPHYYAGMAMRGSNKPEDAKRHFKSFRKLGGDRKLLPE